MLILPLGAEIYLSLVLLYILLVAVAVSKISKLNYGFITLELTGLLSSLGFLFSFFAILNGFSCIGAFSSFVLDQGMVFDTTSLFVSTALLALSFAVLCYHVSYGFFTGSVDFEIPVLVGYSVLSMLVLASSSDFVVAYLAVELQSLVFYVLAASNRSSFLSTEAGLKYFVLGAFVSGLMLFGISAIYVISGSVDFYSLRILISESTLAPGILLGLAFFTSAIFFKLSIFPFHSWTPDVYEGSPLPITAFFSSVPKLAVLTFVFRIYFSVFFTSAAEWNFILTLAAVFTLLVGTFGAVYQTTFKRLLAYSTISHVGFILLGFSSGTFFGLVGAMIYVFIYSITSLGVFGLLLTHYYRNSLPGRSIYMENLHELRTLFNTSPVSSFLFAMFLLSLSGVPPLAGFFGKYSVLVSLVDSQMYTAAVLAVLTSVVSAYYYLRLVKLTFFIRPLLWARRQFSSDFGYLLAFLALFNSVFLFIFNGFSLALTLYLSI